MRLPGGLVNGVGLSSGDGGPGSHTPTVIVCGGLWLVKIQSNAKYGRRPVT